jgi:hypothetical protein
MSLAAAGQPEQQSGEPPPTDLVVPRALQPASMRFATPESKVTMTAAVVAKPSQSLISAKTGVMLGPGLPARVRVIR